jgi:hypothetical protein
LNEVSHLTRLRLEPTEPVSLTYENFPAISPRCEQGGTKLGLPRFALMERFFLSIICVSAALLVAAILATNPVVADGQSPQTPVLRLVQR